jgi:hypothetical protein
MFGGGEVSQSAAGDLDVKVSGRSGLSIPRVERGRASFESISFALASGDADVWPVALLGESTGSLPVPLLEYLILLALPGEGEAGRREEGRRGGCGILACGLHCTCTVWEYVCWYGICT